MYVSLFLYPKVLDFFALKGFKYEIISIINACEFTNKTIAIIIRIYFFIFDNNEINIINVFDV